MVEQVVIQEPETTSEKPEVQETEVSRPEGLPEVAEEAPIAALQWADRLALVALSSFSALRPATLISEEPQEA